MYGHRNWETEWLKKDQVGLCMRVLAAIILKAILLESLAPKIYSAG